MELLHKYHGEGAIGKHYLLIWHASYADTTLRLYKDRLILDVWPRRVEIPYSKIDSIEYKRRILISGWKTMKINHHADAPPLLFFRNLSDNEEILNFLKQRGIKII